MKILLVGIDFFGYTASLKRGFERLGHTVKMCEIKNGWGIIGKIHRELHNFYQKQIRHENSFYSNPIFLQELRSRKVVEVAEAFQPNLLVAFPGYGLTPDALKRMGNYHKSIWMRQ